MTIPVSTAPAAKSWLYNQLKTAVTPVSTNTLQVLYANFTTSATVPDEVVFVGDVTNRRLDYLAMVGGQGPSAFTETYLINGTVSVFRMGTRPEEADARAWALYAQVESVMRTDPTFGGLLVTSKPLDASAAVAPNDNGDGVTCEIPFTVQCLAEL